MLTGTPQGAALSGRFPFLRAGDVVAYVASPRSGSTTGTAIAVDGGRQDLRLRPER